MRWPAWSRAVTLCWRTYLTRLLCMPSTLIQSSVFRRLSQTSSRTFWSTLVLECQSSRYFSVFLEQSVYILAIMWYVAHIYLMINSTLHNTAGWGHKGGFASVILKNSCWRYMTLLNGETGQWGAGSDEIDDKHVFKQDHLCPQQTRWKTYNNC